MSEPDPDPDVAEAKTIRVATQSDPISDLRRQAEEGLPPGSILRGRYELRSELGRGGMGIVYKVIDRKLERAVALKVLMRHLHLDKDHLERFAAEAKVTAQLQHPSIVPVFDVDETEEGLAFYTMRLVEGRTLVDLAEEGWVEQPAGEQRWTLHRLVQVIMQACQAVAFAHSRGVIHRDLKPGNVMVGRYGEVHVLDWGLAKALDTVWTGPPPEEGGAPAPADAAPLTIRRALTQTGTICGTPAYMAPEQAAGHAVDARADIYALGGILYTVLCAHLPHDGTTSEVLWKLTNGRAPPLPSARRAGVPRDLDAICLRALAASPLDRHPTAQDLADALEGWLEGRTPVGDVRPQDAEYLRHYRPSEFRRASVTVDVVLLHAPPGAAHPYAFLHRRARSPFMGCWALPGAFLRMEDDLEQAARRVLADEVGVDDPALRLEQLGAFGAPSRDPRTRVVTVAYLIVATARPETRTPPEQADALAWFQVEEDGAGGVKLKAECGTEPAETAFDHGQLLAAALRRWRGR